jgi:hypothetical protein
METGLVAAVTLAAPAAHGEDAAEPRLAVGASATVWVPQSDADDVADTSLGVRPQVTYWVIPLVGVTASFDYVFVNEESGAGDTTYYVISAGGRLTLPKPATIKPYGELVLGWHVLDAEGFDESDLGFRLGGGAMFAVGTSLVASAGAAYSTVSLDGPFGTDFDVSAFVLDVGIAARF